MGQRGMNLDDMKHGYIKISKWNTAKWDDYTPFVLQVSSGTKGDKACATKHLAQIMHHRDPMRCPIAWIGHYFAYAPPSHAHPRLLDHHFASSRLREPTTNLAHLHRW